MVQDRAEVKVTLDARQAQQQARRARERIRRAERRAVREAADREQAAQQIGAIGTAARTGGISGAAAASTGVAAARAAAANPGTAAAVGRAAATVGGAAAVALGGIELGVAVGELLSEATLIPIIRRIIESLPGTLPNEEAIIASLQQEARNAVREAADEARAATRFEALTSQLARADVFPIAAAFGRAGQGFTVGEALLFSDNFVDRSRRDSFLARQEAARNTRGATDEVIRAIRAAFGE